MVAPRLPWIECLVSSRPYPVESIDEMRVSMAITRLTFGGFAATPESLNLSLAITAAGLSDGLTSYDNYPDEAIDTAVALTGGSLGLALRSYDNYPDEAIDTAVTVTGGSMQDVLIQYQNYPDEALDTGVSITSGELQ